MTHYRANNPGPASTVEAMCGKTVPVKEATAWLHKVTCKECIAAQTKKAKPKGNLWR